jgi:hypothetical protein
MPPDILGRHYYTRLSIKKPAAGISRGWQGFTTIYQSGFQTGRLFNFKNGLVKSKSAGFKSKTTGHGAPVVQAGSIDHAGFRHFHAVSV